MTEQAINQDPKDLWLWRVIYNDDGTDCLDEHEADGTPHTYAEIDQSRLKAFMLLPQIDGLPIHALHLSLDMRLIWYRKHAIDWNGPNAGEHRTVCCLGYQKTIRGVNVQSILAVYPNGATLHVDDESLIVP